MNRPWKAAAILLVSSIVGCGGGGGGGGGGGTPPPPPAPIMQVLPQSYDFGRVTSGNTPEPLVVTIRNVGNAPLSVGPVGFATGSDPEFTFDFATAQPCGSGAFTVAAAGSCTFRVNFRPTSNKAYAASVRVTPTAGAAPAVVDIQGTAESVSALTVRINQVDTAACPSNAATAYVSVTDQGGFFVTGLGTNQFTLRQGSPLSNNLLLSATPVSAAYKPLALSAVIDNSGSITSNPVAFSEMKTGFASLFNALRGNDVGELINFGTVFQITVPYPSPSSTGNPTNKAALVDGLSAPWAGGVGTLLYDTLYRAIDDAALQTAYRRAVIVATDGVDTNENGTGPASTRTRAEVIANAVSKRVPVFAIGIGGSVDTAALQELASGTGGVFYRAGTSQNLATIYAQLSSLLFEDQYVLTFDQLTPGAGTVSPLRVDVVGPTGLTGNATSSITACN